MGLKITVAMKTYITTVSSYNVSVLHSALAALTWEGKAAKQAGRKRIGSGKMQKDRNSQDRCCPTNQVIQLKQLIVSRQKSRQHSKLRYD